MRSLVLLFFLVTSCAASAQLEEIAVTGSRIDGYGGMPTVTITKAADFLVQEIRLINDSRSPELRRKEIIATIEGLLKSASAAQNVALSYGDGFLFPVDLNDESLQIIEDQKRPDTSVVDIYVKVALDRGDDTKKRITELRKFIAMASLVGRTEIASEGDVGLSIVNPEKYRHEILSKISAENGQLVKAMGDSCRVKINGLESRVEWERTAVAELTLYIPYSLEISDCVRR